MSSANLPEVRNLRLFQISIDFHRELDPEAVKNTFGKAIDWIHYMPNCWLVLTTSSAERWYGRLQPLLGDMDTMLICEIDANKVFGWIPKWAIKWLKQSGERIAQSKQAS